MAIQITPTDALIVVDMQNDFMPGGSLAVPEGDLIIPIINQLLHCFTYRIFTRDWHPPDHISFSETPTFSDQSWPVHCVRNTPGAAFHPDLQITLADLVISKAMDAKKDVYSGFEGTNLINDLHQHSVQRVFITGVATEYCVKSTAQDAHTNGFETFILQNAIKGINQPVGSDIAALVALQQIGIQCIQTGDITCP